MTEIAGFPAPGHVLDGPGGPIRIPDSDDLYPDGILTDREFEASQAASIAKRLESSIDYSPAGQSHPADGKLSLHDAAVLVSRLSNTRLAQVFNLELHAADGVDKQQLFTNALFAAMGPHAAERYGQIVSLAQSQGDSIQTRQHGVDLWVGKLDTKARAEVTGRLDARWNHRSLTELALTPLPPQLPRFQCVDIGTAASSPKIDMDLDAAIKAFRKGAFDPAPYKPPLPTD